jgi:hypothetical protein
VTHLKSKTGKPGTHISGARLEPRRFQSSRGSIGFNSCTALDSTAVEPWIKQLYSPHLEQLGGVVRLPRGGVPEVRAEDLGPPRHRGGVADGRERGHRGVRVRVLEGDGQRAGRRGGCCVSGASAWLMVHKPQKGKVWSEHTQKPPRFFFILCKRVGVQDESAFLSPLPLPVAAHGVARDGLQAGRRGEVRLDESGELLRDVRVHVIVGRPRRVRRVNVEARSGTQVVALVLARDTRAARGGVREHHDDAGFRGGFERAPLLHRVVVRAREPAEVVQHGARGERRSWGEVGREGHRPSRGGGGVRVLAQLAAEHLARALELHVMSAECSDEGVGATIWERSCNGICDAAS